MAISNEDIDFHEPTAPLSPHWAETNFFSFHIPEENITAHVCTMNKTVLGVTLAEVWLIHGISNNWADSLYVDSRYHLPVIKKLSDYETASGIRVKALNARDYDVSYTGYGGMELEFKFRGLMEPFDISDPNHSPKARAGATIEERAQASGYGSAYTGHFDLTGKIDGTLKIYGRTLPIDCVDTMGHSWGLRPEASDGASGTIAHAHFGPDLVLHWINKWDSEGAPRTKAQLAHGYIMEDGVAYGLTDLKLVPERTDGMLMSITLEAVDKRGRVLKMRGVTQAGAPVPHYHFVDSYYSYMRWELEDGRIGYGLVIDAKAMSEISSEKGKIWAAGK